MGTLVAENTAQTLGYHLVDKKAFATIQTKPFSNSKASSVLTLLETLCRFKPTFAQYPVQRTPIRPAW